ncbi:hypothetical protein L6R50_19130 [Myxococcota bacterium]|nr:hypothetical protein [Myxococcota bacterium]
MASEDAGAASLRRLGAEVARDRRVLATLGEDLSTAGERLREAGTDEAPLVYVAYKLHQWYTGLESLLQRIERTFGAEPSGGDWHDELLQGAFLEIPRVRPAVLRPDSRRALGELRRFRHFFRHAYAVSLDAGRIERLAADLAGVRGGVDQALADFETFLEEAASRLAEGE